MFSLLNLANSLEITSLIRTLLLQYHFNIIIYSHLIPERRYQMLWEYNWSSLRWTY